jgi:hypothetical protein
VDKAQQWRRRPTRITIQNSSISSIAYKELTWELKVRKVYENEIVVMSPYILWEQVPEFINGQG